MPVKHLNGIDLHTQVQGDRGPLLVMLHGLVAGSIATWCFKFAPMLAKRYRVLLYDMRGHGRSERTGSGFDLDTMARDLDALIKHYQRELGMQSGGVHLVGHSYGALVALHYAIFRDSWDGSAVDSLALVDAPLPANHYIAPSLEQVADKDGVRSVALAMMDHLGVHGGRRQKKLVEQLQYLYLDSTLKQDVARAGDYEDSVLESLSMPVLLVYGEQSDCLSAGRRLARLIHGSHLSILPCGHYISVEEPERLAAELGRYYLEARHG